MPSPILLHMLGIPGAGKTTFLNTLQTLWADEPPPVLLGFDQVMQAMPEYQAMEDKVAAFAAFELPARELGYRRLDELIGQRCSILFDNGGSAATHVDILRRAQQLGYCVVLVSIGTDISDAQCRVNLRAVTEGQHTPMTYLEERAEKLAALETEYQALTPYFYRIINDGQDFAAFRKKCVEVAENLLHDLRQEADR
jgi:predicted ABC-type ATPase